MALAELEKVSTPKEMMLEVFELEKVSTQKERVMASKEAYQCECNLRDPKEVAEELCGAMEQCLTDKCDDDPVSRWRRGLGCLFVVDAALKKSDDPTSAVALLTALAPERLVTLLRLLGDLYRPDADASEARRLVRVWTKRLSPSIPGLVTLDDLFPAAAPPQEEEEAAPEKPQIRGVVVKMLKYGAFCDTVDGRQGLLHFNRMKKKMFVRRGDKLLLEILSEQKNGRLEFAMLSIEERRGDTKNVQPVVVDLENNKKKRRKRKRQENNAETENKKQQTEDPPPPVASSSSSSQEKAPPPDAGVVDDGNKDEPKTVTDARNAPLQTKPRKGGGGETFEIKSYAEIMAEKNNRSSIPQDQEE